jgi:hypothetical protein
MSVDGRLKRCAFDVLAAEDHFGGRNKVRVFMDNVQNRVEALLFLGCHAAKCSMPLPRSSPILPGGNSSEIRRNGRRRLTAGRVVRRSDIGRKRRSARLLPICPAPVNWPEDPLPALGARRDEVVRMVVQQGMAMAAAGIGVGAVAALGLTRVMGSLLYEIAPTDGLTFGVVCCVLAAAAFVACCLPALRASKVDPVVALRYE